MLPWLQPEAQGFSFPLLSCHMPMRVKLLFKCKIMPISKFCDTGAWLLEMREAKAACFNSTYNVYIQQTNLKTIPKCVTNLSNYLNGKLTISWRPRVAVVCIRGKGSKAH